MVQVEETVANKKNVDNKNQYSGRYIEYSKTCCSSNI